MNQGNVEVIDTNDVTKVAVYKVATIFFAFPISIRN